MQSGEDISEPTGVTEVSLLLVEGKAEITSTGQNLADLDDRLDVFEGSPPYSVDVRMRLDWRARGSCSRAICRPTSLTGMRRAAASTKRRARKITAW